MSPSCAARCELSPFGDAYIHHRNGGSHEQPERAFCSFRAQRMLKGPSGPQGRSIRRQYAAAAISAVAETSMWELVAADLSAFRRRLRRDLAGAQARRRAGRPELPIGSGESGVNGISLDFVEALGQLDVRAPRIDDEGGVDAEGVDAAIGDGRFDALPQ
jgi:hypothetical protein